MAGQIPTGDIHHLRLTVTDVGRSRQFYTSLLGFAVEVESPPEGDPSAAGVFKVLFGGVVASHDDREQAARLLEEHGVKHGEIASLPSFGIDALSFEDPDGVQLELTALMTQPVQGT